MKYKFSYYLLLAFSIILPIIIGGIYFLDQYKKNNSNVILAQITEKPDIVFLNEEKIIGIDDVKIEDKNYLMGNSIKFLINNPTVNFTKYNLKLVDIHISNKVELTDIHWKLALCDDRGNIMKIVSSGDFSNIESNELNILQNGLIDRNQSNNYKLYYYLVSKKDSTNYAGTEFFAKLDIE